MKRAIWGLLAAGLISASTGCCMTGNNCTTCDGYPTRGECGPGGGCGPGGYGANGNGAGGYGAGGYGAKGGIHPRLAALHGNRYSPDFGPASAAIAYPYYTTRGPRDFLEPAPPTIGR
jgi:hypothetical protein